jgi:hypothetical protein
LSLPHILPHKKLLFFRKHCRSFAACIAAVFSGRITAGIFGNFSGIFVGYITTKLIFTFQLPLVLQHLLPRVCITYCRDFAAISKLFCRGFTAL